MRDHAEGRAGRRSRSSTRPTTSRSSPGWRPSPPRPGPGWPALGRIALLHRTGPLAVTDAAVVVVVSAPHRAEAFDAARFCIDTLKATVPIWKKETWAGGEDWGTDATPVDQAEVAIP